MAKRIIKMINNERLNSKIVSSKACSPGAEDHCNIGYDFAECTTYAYDECGKDYSACYNGADDICNNVDNNAPCHGAGEHDYT